MSLSLAHLRPRIGLLGKFAVASAVPVVVLGLVLANYLGNQIHDRTLRSSVQAADLTVRLGIEPHLTRDALGRGLPAAQAEALDDAVRGMTPGDLHVARIQIWNEQRKISTPPTPAHRPRRAG